MIDKFRVDGTRVYALFATSPDRELDWREDGVAGVSRFLARLYRVAIKYAPLVRTVPLASPEQITSYGQSTTAAALLRTLHQTIARITEDFNGRWHFNTTVSAIMSLVNELTAAEATLDTGEVSPVVIAEVLRSTVLMLAPFAPFLTSELWEQLGGTGHIFRQPFPVANPDLAREDEVEIPVQANGKLVVVIRVTPDAGDDVIKAAALADEKVIARLQGKTLVKTILVKGKLVNLVLR